MTVAESFKMQRELKGLSQCELAKAINVSQSMVAQIESAVRIPSISIIIDTAKYLHCTTDSLLGLEIRNEV
jgi:transcriptional regulator with XRE-family HTH domain